MFDFIIFIICILFESENRVCEKQVSSQLDFVQNDGIHFRGINSFSNILKLSGNSFQWYGMFYLEKRLASVTIEGYNILSYMETKKEFSWCIIT